MHSVHENPYSFIQVPPTPSGDALKDKNNNFKESFHGGLSAFMPNCPSACSVTRTATSPDNLSLGPKEAQRLRKT